MLTLPAHVEGLFDQLATGALLELLQAVACEAQCIRDAFFAVTLTGQLLDDL